MKYRKRPVVIDAMQWTGDTRLFGPGFLKGANAAINLTQPDQLILRTLEGDMTASIGDWIIKGIAGEFYPCKPDIFAATYEAVDA